jgi:hypothetical protein
MPTTLVATSWTIHGQSVAAWGGSGLPWVCENPRKTGSSGFPLPPVASYPRPSKPRVTGSSPVGRASLVEGLRPSNFPTRSRGGPFDPGSVRVAHSLSLVRSCGFAPRTSRHALAGAPSIPAPFAWLARSHSFAPGPSPSHSATRSLAAAPSMSSTAMTAGFRSTTF